MRKLHFIWLVAALSVSCTTTDKLVITGESLVQLGDQFVATADTMNVGYTNGVITKDQYKAWVTFGKKFQQVYPQAVQLWKVAKQTGDQELEARMVATVASLAMGLSNFSGIEAK